VTAAPFPGAAGPSPTSRSGSRVIVGAYIPGMRAR
jgi:hypothetical protein